MVDDDFIQEEYTPETGKPIQFEYKEPENKFTEDKPELEKEPEEIKKQVIKSNLNVKDKKPVNAESAKHSKKVVKDDKPMKKQVYSKNSKKRNVENKNNIDYKNTIGKIIKKIKQKSKSSINFVNNSVMSLNNRSVDKNRKRGKAKINNIITIAAIVAIIAISVFVLNINKIFPEPGVPVAIVNGEIVTTDDIDETLKTLPSVYRSLFTDEMALNQTIMNVLLMQEVRKLGVVATDYDVKEALEQARGSAEMSQSEFKEFLFQNNLTYKDMEGFYRTHLSIENLLEATVYSDIAVTDDEIKEFYDSSDMFDNIAFDDVEEDINDLLIQEAKSDVFSFYVSELMDNADIRIVEVSDGVSGATTFFSEDVEKYSRCAVENGLTKDTIVFVYSDGCPHCVRMKPIVGELEEEEYNFKWASVADNDVKGLLRDCFSDVLAGGVPQFICAKNGENLVGEKSKSVLRDFADICK